MNFYVTERGEMAYQLPALHSNLTKKLKSGDALLAISKCSEKETLHNFLLKYKDITIFHATITGFGGTKIERGVKTYQETIQGLNVLINKGFPANQIVLRVDPIIPTKKGIETARKVLEIKPTNINRIRFSFIDNYKNIKPYLPWKTFHSPLLFQEHALSMLHEYSGYCSLEACGEPQLFSENTGCISKLDFEILNLPLPELKLKKQRKGCKCLNNKTEILEKPKSCPNGCVYCYYGLGGA